MNRSEFCWRAAAAAAIGLGLLALALMVGWLAQVWLIAFAGVLVAVMLRAGASRLSRWTRLRDGWAVGVVALVLALTVMAVFWVGGQRIAEQSRELVTQLQQSLAAVQDRYLDTTAGQWVANQQPLENGMPDMWARFGNASRVTLQAVTATLLALVVGLFLALQPRLYLDGLLRLLPVQRRRQGRELAARLHDTLQGWLLGQGISMLMLWLSTWLVLALLGVPLAFILGLLTGLLTFIPYLGPLLAVVPIALVAFMESPTLALWAIGAFLVIQNIEGNLITPLIFQHTVQLPPALTLMAQASLGTLFGFAGIVLATPLLAVAVVLVQFAYVRGVLDDTMEHPVDGPSREPPPPGQGAGDGSASAATRGHG